MSIAPDDVELLKLGYKPQLDRGVNFFMNFSFGFTEVGVLVSLTQVLSVGLTAGGPAAVIWGWITVSLFTIGIGYSMAEICSAYPSAGSVYHWSAQLVPKKWAPLTSYITGYFNFAGNAAGDAAFAYAWAAILDAANQTSGKKAMTVKQLVGVAIGILLLWSLLNVFKISHVGFLNSIAAWLHFGTLVGICVGVLASGWKNRNSAEFVFTQTYNGTGFTSPSYVAAIGLLMSCYGFAGYEASAHMAEETQGSAKAAPKGLIGTCVMTALGGFLFLLPMLFVMGPIDAMLSNGTGIASVNIWIYACGKDGAKAICWLIVANLFFAGLASVTVTGRITYALIRDNAFPFSKYLQGVSTAKSPVRPIFMVFIVDALILLLPLTGDNNGVIAFNSITALTVIGFQVSYGIPILLRCTTARKYFQPKEIKLGRLAVPLGYLSFSWLFGTSVLMFFPSEGPKPKPATMNYVVVVVGCFALIGAGYWLTTGKTKFRGPKRADEIEAEAAEEELKAAANHAPHHLAEHPITTVYVTA